MRLTIFNSLKIILLCGLILKVHAQDMEIKGMVLNTKKNFTANSITIGPAVTISGGGDVKINANTVAIKPQFFIAVGGQLQIISGGVTVGINPQKNTIPKDFIVKQNYPNPFNPSTHISYSLPKAANVNLIIYNTSGQMVKTLLSKYQEPGNYVVTWDGTGKAGTRLSSGMYYYALKAGSHYVVKRMIMIK